jgi:hypothetical protein
MERYEQDPVDRKVDSTYVETSSDSGVTWFIVGALVIAAGVLAYLYFGGDDANTTAETPPPAINAPADTGRASTPTAPAEPTAPAAPEPAPAPMAPPAPSPAP